MIAGSSLPGYSDIKKMKREKKKMKKKRNLQTFISIAAGLAVSASGICSSLTEAQAKIGNTIDIDRCWWNSWKGIVQLAINDEEIKVTTLKTLPYHPL